MNTALRRVVRHEDEIDGWWVDIEHEVLACVAPRGTSPAEIAARLSMSEPAVCSVIAMLVEQGKIRISQVEAV